MTSLSFDSKLQNWSGAQQAIISVEARCISMSPGEEGKKVKICSCGRLLIFDIGRLFWCQYLGALWEEISRSLMYLISPTDQRKPISDPSRRHDKKTLQYNGLFPLLVTSHPKSLSLSLSLSLLCSHSLSHSELNKCLYRYDRHKTNVEANKTAEIVAAPFPPTRRRQQWRYSVTLLGSW